MLIHIFLLHIHTIMYLNLSLVISQKWMTAQAQNECFVSIWQEHLKRYTLTALWSPRLLEITTRLLLVVKILSSRVHRILLLRVQYESLSREITYRRLKETSFRRFIRTIVLRLVLDKMVLVNPLVVIVRKRLLATMHSISMKMLKVELVVIQSLLMISLKHKSLVVYISCLLLVKKWVQTQKLLVFS